VEEAERRVRVAELEGLPDFDLGIGYRIRRDVDGDPVHGADFVSAGVTVRLPVDRRKWRARVAEAHADLRHARAGYRRETANLLYRVRSAHAELVRSDAEARLLETGLLPQARQSLESSRAGYEVGRIDFLSLLDSQVSLLRAELREVRALANRRQAFAALEAAAGEGLR
jgi:outer membrane protein TolC